MRRGKFGLVARNRLREEAEKHHQTLQVKLERPLDHVSFPDPPRINQE
jgi:hypothetical protein